MAILLKRQLTDAEKQRIIETHGRNCFATGHPIKEDKNDDKVALEYDGRRIASILHMCPVTNWKYFYITLPVEIIDSDDSSDKSLGLQPRYLIFDKLFEMFRHFQRHPVLQPSIGRVFENKIIIFDGQHKIASFLWTARRVFG